VHREHHVLRSIRFVVLCLSVVIGLTSFTYAVDVPIQKTSNLCILYGAVALLAVSTALIYVITAKKKLPWFLLLYGAVATADVGYFLLSISDTLNGALFANTISYLGSAALPLAMLLIIMDACGIKRSRAVTGGLIAVSASAFLLAASGPHFGLYYREVYLDEINGMTFLQKVYGPLHTLYTVYLALYFAAMLAVIGYTIFKKHESNYYSIFLAAIVFGNLVIWFVEQRLTTYFEFLSVSYILTELFLLLVNNMQKAARDVAEQLQQALDAESTAHTASASSDLDELFDSFAERAQSLTSTERSILRYYAEGKDLNEVAELAFISIHTVRKHNSNIYQKLGVGSKDELLLYIELFRRSDRLSELL